MFVCEWTLRSFPEREECQGGGLPLLADLTQGGIVPLRAGARQEFCEARGWPYGSVNRWIQTALSNSKRQTAFHRRAQRFVRGVIAFPVAAVLIGIRLRKKFHVFVKCRTWNPLNNTVETNSIAQDSGWSFSFWFAISSPFVGVLLGLLAAAIVCRWPEKAMSITAIIFILIILLFAFDSKGQVKRRG
jgi:hypothetical protein